MLAPVVVAVVGQGWYRKKGYVVPCVTTQLPRKSHLGNVAQPAADSGGCPQQLSVWHRLAWQVAVRVQASFLPGWGSTSPVYCPCRKGAGWPPQGEK